MRHIVCLEPVARNVIFTDTKDYPITVKNYTTLQRLNKTLVNKFETILNSNYIRIKYAVNKPQLFGNIKCSAVRMNKFFR